MFGMLYRKYKTSWNSLDELIIDMQRAIFEFAERNKIAISEFSSKCVGDKPKSCDNIQITLNGRFRDENKDFYHYGEYSSTEVARVWHDLKKERDKD